ncbi:MAG: hypothetical protein JWN03_169 [Nocardia sp.]|uniref:hypothetical protein n=1 Tax=Nocardia sp. TaxID=1821 RepID=UPI00260A0EE2|nr:hypothetical protein [Nocardia sp.]MCU1639894.1 hypothetical protein [Nocardia sp.]
MRIRESRWFRWGIALLALLIVIVGALSIAVGLLTFGHHRLEDRHNRPSEARRIADAATVAGFARTAIVDMDDGDNPPYADAYFIGPDPKPDLLGVVSVPTIQLKAADSPSAEDERRNPDIDFAVVNGQRPDGCEASAWFVSNPTSSAHGTKRNEWVSILSDEQLAEVRNHTAVVIELGIDNCGW